MGRKGLLLRPSRPSDAQASTSARTPLHPLVFFLFVCLLFGIDICLFVWFVSLVCLFSLFVCLAGLFVLFICLFV